MIIKINSIYLQKAPAPIEFETAPHNITNNLNKENNSIELSYFINGMLYGGAGIPEKGIHYETTHEGNQPISFYIENKYELKELITLLEYNLREWEKIEQNDKNN